MVASMKVHGRAPYQSATSNNSIHAAANLQQSKLKSEIVFDKDHLYIGAELLDSDADGLLANQMVRDGALNADDRLMWVLDPTSVGGSGDGCDSGGGGASGDGGGWSPPAGDKRNRHNAESRVGRHLDRSCAPA